MEKETITIILAIWGAFVSSVAIGWNFYRDISQRGRLRVLCYIGKIVDKYGLDPKDYLVWNITNIGKEPVMLTHIGGAYKAKKHFMLTPHLEPFPKMLQPGERVIEYTEDLTVLGNNLKSLYASDSLDELIKLPVNKQKSL